MERWIPHPNGDDKDDQEEWKFFHIFFILSQQHSSRFLSSKTNQLNSFHSHLLWKNFFILWSFFFRFRTSQLFWIATYLLQRKRGKRHKVYTIFFSILFATERQRPAPQHTHHYHNYTRTAVLGCMWGANLVFSIFISTTTYLEGKKLFSFSWIYLQLCFFARFHSVGTSLSLLNILLFSFRSYPRHLCPRCAHVEWKNKL